VPTYYLLATTEAASNLARYDGVRYGLRREALGRLDNTVTQTRSSGFGLEVQLRILLGTFASSHEHAAQFHHRAERARAALRARFAALFTQCDVVLSPTAPIPAFAADAFPDDPLALYLCDALTVPQSLCGLPALSIPGGRSRDGRPIGVQWTAPADHELLLLQLAAVFRAHTDHHLHRPLP
jgi:aspartyl-tRNA(Asn)/glutamyl-tRNA(Gln) amidotransferase subunit A